MQRMKTEGHEKFSLVNGGNDYIQTTCIMLHTASLQGHLCSELLWWAETKMYEIIRNQEEMWKCVALHSEWPTQ